MPQVVQVFFSLLVSAPALAADETEVPVEALANRTELSGAFSHSVSEPFAARRGVAVRGIHHVSPVFAFGVEGAYYPDFGERQWTSVTRHLIDASSVSPDMEIVNGHVAVRVEFAPVTGVIGRGAHSSTVGLYGLLGFGVLNTRADIKAIGCSGFRPCGPGPTANQVHPSTTLGVGLRLHHKRLISRLELRDVGYVESYPWAVLGIEHLLLADLSVGVLLGRR